VSFWIVTAKKLGMYKCVLLKNSYKYYEILRLMEQFIDNYSKIEIGGRMFGQTIRTKYNSDHMGFR
jgi:hypothetical protein